MIKIGIAGAETPLGGELLRLLIHHPDVEISTAYSPSTAGRNVSSIHHGFIGEERIIFSSNFDATGLDVAFLLRPLYADSDWTKLMADRPGLKLILYPEAASVGDALMQTPVYGLSEMNRKPLVRGARVAVVPRPLASPVLVGLFPLAAHLMLPDRLKIELEAPEDMLSDSEVVMASEEISRQLQSVQSSFSGSVELCATPGASSRTYKTAIEFPSSISREELMKIYDSIYDDHNFTFMTTISVVPEEVEHTHRIVISLLKPEPGKVRIEIVADARMRGGAAEGVHIMNLLFNLHEKTGLTLPTSGW